MKKRWNILGCQLKVTLILTFDKSNANHRLFVGIVKGSPNSRHYTTRLLPHRHKLRSLINDIAIPDSLKSDTSLPSNGPLLSELAIMSKMTYGIA